MLSCSSLGSIFSSIFRIIKIINYFIYLILLEIIIIVVIVSAFCFFCLFIFIFVVKSLCCIVTPWIEAHPVSSVPGISEARVLECSPSHLTLCEPQNYSQLGSTVHGIFQARIVEWVAFPSPGNLPNLRTEPMYSVLASRFFTTESAHVWQILIHLWFLHIV